MAWRMLHLMVCGMPALAWAQWVNVSGGLGNLAVKSMFSYADTVMVGTSNGIFRTEDLGGTWADISGDIGSRVVYDLRGGGGPRTMWVSTADGPWFTLDQQHYVDHTATGLTTPDITYYWFGDSDVEESDWAVGTNGGGLFVGPDLDGPWTPAGVGLEGAGLFIRDLSGYSGDDEDYAALATDGGLYVSTDHMASWTARNADLDAASLHMRRLVVLGSGILAATQGGLYLSMDTGESWLPLVQGQRFSAVHYGPQVGLLAFGEGGTHSSDFVQYNSVDMSGVSGGDVTCMTLTTTQVLIGTATGGVYRRPIDQFLPVEAAPPRPAGHVLLEGRPNPFNPSTVIPYHLAGPARVRLSIHDLAGRLVEVLVDETQPAGTHEGRWDAGRLSSGLYLCRLEAEGLPVAAGRLLLLR